MVSLGEYAKLAKVAITAAVCATLFIGGCNHGQSTQQAKTDKVSAEFAKYRDNVDMLSQRAEKMAKSRHEQYEQAKKDAERAYNDGHKAGKMANQVAVDDLRAERIRLRNGWDACMRRPAATPETTASREDEQSYVLPEGFGRVLRIASDADQHVSWLQSELIATRKLAESCGRTE